MSCRRSWLKKDQVDRRERQAASQTRSRRAAKTAARERIAQAGEGDPFLRPSRKDIPAIGQRPAELLSLQRPRQPSIEPGSPWQNAYVESFGGRVRDELLALELFSCLAEAQALIEDRRVDYQHRPHSTLGMMTPAAFAAPSANQRAARSLVRLGKSHRPSRRATRTAPSHAVIAPTGSSC